MARRSGSLEAEGSLTRGTPGRVESSPDNDGMDQYCQMIQARQARRKGVRRGTSVLTPLKLNHQLESGGSGLGCNADLHDGSRAGNSLAG